MGECMQPRFWIPPHVFVCATHDGAIFLDLKADQYLGIPLQQAQVLSAVVTGWPIWNCADASEQAVQLSVAADLANQLVARGLLTNSACGEKTQTFVVASRTASLVALGQGTTSSRRMTAVDVWRFVAALLSAASRLRFCSLESVVEHVSARKQRKLHPDTRFDPQQAAQHIALFRRLRPFVFTANNRCVFHSVALLEFLSSYDCFPSWVIGVKSSPFAAHSWVEQDGFILDSTPEEICFYTPILTV